MTERVIRSVVTGEQVAAALMVGDAEILERAAIIIRARSTKPDALFVKFLVKALRALAGRLREKAAA